MNIHSGDGNSAKKKLTMTYKKMEHAKSKIAHPSVFLGAASAHFVPA